MDHAANGANILLNDYGYLRRKLATRMKPENVKATHNPRVGISVTQLLKRRPLVFRVICPQHIETPYYCKTKKGF
jgi:hypothetical protein